MSARDSAYQRLAATRPRPMLTGDPLEVFAARLERQGGRCVRVADVAAARRWLVTFIDNHAARPASAALSDAWCSPLLDPAEPGPLLRMAMAHQEARVGVCTALAAVAETGSVLLCPGRDSPLGLCFLAEHLVVLLRRVDVVDSLEALWTTVDARFGQETPRALCLVAGPSTTGDIAMQFATGVHGPISLHVLLVEEA